MKKNIKSLEIELEDLDDCMNKNTVVDIDLIYKIVPLIISNKYKKRSDSSNFNLFKTS